MKKYAVLIISLFLLVGCSTKEEDSKYAYLEYKNELEKQIEFTNDEGLEFNTFFNIERKSEEEVKYSLVIDNPKVNMHRVKALLVHDYSSDTAFPSVGIFDETRELSSNSNDKIELSGIINSTEDISSTNFKLYLEYDNDMGISNKIYYEVKRG